MIRMLACVCVAGAVLTGCASSALLPAPAEGPDSPAVESQKAGQDVRGPVDRPSQAEPGTAVPIPSDSQQGAEAADGPGEFRSGSESTILLAILLPAYYILIFSGL